MVASHSCSEFLLLLPGPLLIFTAQLLAGWECPGFEWTQNHMPVGPIGLILSDSTLRLHLILFFWNYNYIHKLRFCTHFWTSNWAFGSHDFYIETWVQVFKSCIVKTCSKFTQLFACVTVVANNNCCPRSLKQLPSLKASIMFNMFGSKESAELSELQIST